MKPRVTKRLIQAIAYVSEQGQTNACGCNETGQPPNEHAKNCYVYLGRAEYNRVSDFIEATKCP